MKLPPLQKMKILKKYKMFFVDGFLEDGTLVTAYTKNKGGFKEEMSQGKEVFISQSDNPNRKTKYSVELIHNNGTLSGVDPNIGLKLLQEYLKSKEIKIVDTETTVGKSRLDLKLSVNGKDGFGEIKTVLSYKGHTARFPEAPTPRGQKHLKELIKLAQKGIPAYLFYVIQVPHVNQLSILKDIDPEYATLMKKAVKSGVIITALKCSVSLTEIKIIQEVPIE